MAENKWVAVVITLLIGNITPYITGFWMFLGPPCTYPKNVMGPPSLPRAGLMVEKSHLPMSEDWFAEIPDSQDMTGSLGLSHYAG